MKPAVIVFILAELLDILLTFVGMTVGFSELNPLGYDMVYLVSLKLIAIVCVSLLLQKMDFGKLKNFVWLIPALASIPVFYNIIVLIEAYR